MFCILKMSQCYEKAIFFIEEDKAVEWSSRCIRLTKIRKYWPTYQTEKEQREHRPLRMWVCSVIWKYLHLFVLVEQCWGWFKTYNHIYNWRPLQNGDGEVCTSGASSIASPDYQLWFVICCCCDLWFWTWFDLWIVYIISYIINCYVCIDCILLIVKWNRCYRI